MTRLFVSVALISLVSCDQAEMTLEDETGRQSVDVYFFEASEADLCSYRFNLAPADRDEVYDIIKANLPAFSQETQYFVSQIAFGKETFVDLFSPNFCDGVDQDSVVQSMRKLSLEDPEFLGRPEKKDISDLLSRYGAEFLDLADAAFKDDECVVRLPEGQSVDFSVIYRLRYRYAIPILHQQSDYGTTLVLFEKDCDKADEYARHITELIESEF
jgi:hypothetical protein